MFETKSHKYDDIINLPHHVSENRRQMSLHDRAAQFSSFAALTGYDDAIDETARLTDTFEELSEDARDEIDGKLRLIIEHISEQPIVSVTYFQPDEKKDGGCYVEKRGSVRRISEYEREIIFCDGERVALKCVVGIEVQNY